LSRGPALLWWDMQTGKTRAVLHAFDQLWQRRSDIRHLIVFCPAYARGNWYAEIADKMHLDLPILTAYGITKQRMDPAGLSETIGFTTMPRVTIVGWDVADAWVYKLMKAAQGQVVVLDESHEHATNPGTKRYKAVNRVARLADRTWALTGTIYKKTAMDIYWQGRLTGGFRDLTPEQFGTRYCLVGYSKFKKMWEYRGLRRGVEEKLVDLMPNLSRVHEEDCYDIPTVRRIDRWVDVGSGYTGGNNEANMEKARSALVGLKVQRTLEFLNDLPQRPVVVFGWHRDFVSRLAAKIPGSACVTGDTSTSERADIQRRFASGNIPVIVANLKAFGLSVSLARAAHVIFGEIHWSETDHRQAEGRIKGPAQQAKRIDYTYLMVKNSVEEFVWRVRLNNGRAMDRLDKAASPSIIRSGTG
jgi:superfamily II DNA or RNA helicase